MSISRHRLILPLTRNANNFQVDYIYSVPDVVGRANKPKHRANGRTLHAVIVHASICTCMPTEIYKLRHYLRGTDEKLLYVLIPRISIVSSGAASRFSKPM